MISIITFVLVFSICFEVQAEQPDTTRLRDVFVDNLQVRVLPGVFARRQFMRTVAPRRRMPLVMNLR